MKVINNICTCNGRYSFFSCSFMKNIRIPLNGQSPPGIWGWNFILTLCGCCLTFFVRVRLLLGFLEKITPFEYPILVYCSDSDSDSSSSESSESSDKERKSEEIIADWRRLKRAGSAQIPEKKDQALLELQVEYSKELRNKSTAKEFLKAVFKKLLGEIKSKPDSSLAVQYKNRKFAELNSKQISEDSSEKHPESTSAPQNLKDRYLLEKLIEKSRKDWSKDSSKLDKTENSGNTSGGITGSGTTDTNPSSTNKSTIDFILNKQNTEMPSSSDFDE